MCIRDRSVTINGAALETWFPTADTDLKFDAVFKGKLSDTYDTAEYGPVSYTHLDVYKRQELIAGLSERS